MYFKRALRNAKLQGTAYRLSPRGRRFHETT